MNKISELILDTKVIAVIRLDDLEHAVEISRALLAAGIKVQEFTLTNPNAVNAISAVLEKIPEFTNGQACIGAGSVDSLDKARESIAAGAQFIITPVLQIEVIEFCKNKNVASLPGAFSPTEIHTAWSAGADFVKVFPAGTLGPTYIKDILAPLPELRLIPTGGVSKNNMREFLNNGAVAVGLGSSLFDKAAIEQQDWDAVTAHAKQFLS